MTHEIRLREVAAEDIPVFFEHQRDPEATRMAAFPARDEAAHVAHWAKILADTSVIKRAILCDGEVVGNIGSWEKDARRELGYWIDRAHWGRGIATRALSEFLGIVHTRPLFAHVSVNNPGSQRVLEKCGFRVAGEVRVEDESPGTDIEERILVLESAPGPGERFPDGHIERLTQ
ncbi:MAG: GNAT family N-acetyltransferase [Candidatus Eisenbacteria bacterium]